MLNLFAVLSVVPAVGVTPIAANSCGIPAAFLFYAGSALRAKAESLASRVIFADVADDSGTDPRVAPIFRRQTLVMAKRLQSDGYRIPNGKEVQIVRRAGRCREDFANC
jgi:hypothetical protein